MKKLLCERERHQGHWADDNKGSLKDRQKDEVQDFEDWAPGGKISLGKNPYGRSRRNKSLNENLNPLRNFLKKSVGRKWDEVFSEINEVCPNDSAVNAHVYQHLYQYVQLHPLIIDGKVYRPWHEQRTWYHNGNQDELCPLEGSPTYPCLYVDPADGILRMAPHRQDRLREENRKKLKERERYEKWMDADHMAVKANDIWWEATLSPIPPERTEPFFDTEGHILRTEVRWPVIYDHYIITLDDDRAPWPFKKKEKHRFGEADRVRALQTYYGKRVFCSKLRQLGSKEIRKMNLRNG